MLYILIGGEATKRAQLRRKLYRGALEELDPSISEEELASLAGTPSFLNDSRGFFVRSFFISEENDREAKFLEIAEGLSRSVHTFLFEEEKLGAKTVQKLEKTEATIEILSAKEKKQGLNVFALADAMAKRDRKRLWLLLMQAYREGISAENIAGVLSWKARTQLAGARSESERMQFEKLSRELVMMYHDSHRKAGDLSLLLERFALTL